MGYFEGPCLKLAGLWELQFTHAESKISKCHSSVADVPVWRKSQVCSPDLASAQQHRSSRMDLEPQAEVRTSAVTVISVQVKDPTMDSRYLYSRVDSDWVKRV